MKIKEFFTSTTFLAIIASILWSTAFVGIKIGLKYSTPLQFAGLRFFIAGLMIMPFIPDLREKLIIVRKNFKIILWVGMVQTVIQYSLFYTGMQYVPGALGAMIVGSGPLFVAIVAHIFIPTDRLTKQKLISIFIGLIGVAVITLKPGEMGVVVPMMWVGVLFLFGNHLMSGLGNVLVATDKRKVPPLVLSAFSMLTGGAILFVISLFVEGLQTGPFPFEYWASLGWLSFLSAAAFSIWYTLLRRPGVKVSDLNMWKFIVPVLGAVLSWIMLPDEKPTLTALIGMMFIALALINLNRQTKKRGI